MATKHISDWQVCEAAASGHHATDYLIENTGECWKVCLKALERAEKRKLLQVTCSVSGKLTAKGKAFLAQARKEQDPDTILARNNTITCLNESQRVKVIEAEMTEIRLAKEFEEAVQRFIGPQRAEGTLTGEGYDLSIVIRSELYNCPAGNDRQKIDALLSEVERNHAADAHEILRFGFDRALMESIEDRDTWVVDRFLRAGASVDWSRCLIALVWQARGTGPGCWSRCRPQVVAVLRQLINAGADPDKPWPVLGGKSARQYFASITDNRWPNGAVLTLAALEEAEEQRNLRTRTKPASGQSRMGRRL